MGSRKSRATWLHKGLWQELAPPVALARRPGAALAEPSMADSTGRTAQNLLPLAHNEAGNVARCVPARWMSEARFRVAFRTLPSENFVRTTGC